MGRLRGRAGASAGGAAETCSASLSPHAQWTSSATHAILPLLATDAGVRAQVQVGVDSHRARFGADRWRGGFWLPECAYAPWLERALCDAGVQRRLRRADQPLRAGGPRAPAAAAERVGRGARADRPSHDLAGVERRRLSRERRLPRLPPPHRPPAQAVEQRRRRLRSPARASRWRRKHAADFVARTIARLRDAGAGLSRAAGWRCSPSTPSCSATGGMRASPGLRRSWRSARSRGSSSCAWTTRSSARAGRDRASSAAPASGSRSAARTGSRAAGGAHGDLSTWSGPAVAEMAFAARAAELEVLAAGARAGTGGGARAARAAGQRLGVHDLARRRRSLRA